MNIPEIRGDKRSGAVDLDTVSMKLEAVPIPVSDVDRAKAFYRRLGWRLDADFTSGDFRGVQVTPPGSSCSVHFGRNVTPAQPGTAQNLFLVVRDIEAARDALVRRGIGVTQFFHFDASHTAVHGVAPNHQSYGTYFSFRDIDGNGWLVQEVTTRLPGRVDGTATSFGSMGELASALRRAAAAHDQHEKRFGKTDGSWPEWCAAYLVAEQSGKELPT